MKTYKNLFNGIISFENLLLAARKAQKGKRFKNSTAVFNLNLEKELLKIQSELRSMTYRFGGYRDFYVHDPKRRLISAAPYRDRVVHHALCNVIEPLLDRTFIYDSYACRKGKGTHKAVERYSRFCKRNEYVLKLDISKYFQTVDHEILLDVIKSKINCAGTIWLIKSIIDSRVDESFAWYFSGDDLFTPYRRKKGIPIGNLTSQFFANLYLNGLDHYVKEKLRCRYYIRYADDMVVFSDSKERLHRVKESITEYLEKLRLILHPKKSRIYRTDEGIVFLGYRIFPTHRLLDRGNVLRMRRRLKKMSEDYSLGLADIKEVTQRIMSWIGHAGHADTYELRKRLFADVRFTRGGAEKGASRRLVEQQR